MPAMPDVAPRVEEVRRFLATYHSSPVEDLEPLGGGFWSSAWRYRTGEQRLVLRVSDDDEGFRIDRAAMRFARHGVPVPEVYEVGKALGGAFAISQRRNGRFLEDAEPHEADQAGPALLGLLEACGQCRRRRPIL